MNADFYLPSLHRLRDYFQSEITRSYAFRLEQLKKLRQSIYAHEQELYAALKEDHRKSPEESWVTELGLVVSEISAAIQNLRRWMAPERSSTNLLNLPSSSRVYSEPLGVVLIIAPWNYPFHLLFNPMVGAIAGGNCIVLKPSEFAPASAAVMKKMVESTFSPDYVYYQEGEGSQVIPAMMNNFSFDHVFYTGSTEIGRVVYKMAAERLVPVTLELGGKSPCVVEEDANIEVAARRIALGKFSNCGQMCVAPDYVLVHESVKEKLIGSIRKSLLEFFGEKAQDSYNFGKMINERQFDRVAGYLKQGKIELGGGMDRSGLYIEPTVLTDVALDSPVMNQEIFGPVLPVIAYSNREDAQRIIARHPNPLAFYVFTSSKKKEKDWIQSTSFGGGCINNASWHLTNHHLPFGGRGASGIGRYHGKYSFDTFTHRKTVMKTPTWFDPGIKYPPFKGRLRLFKWVIR